MAVFVRRRPVRSTPMANDLVGLDGRWGQRFAYLVGGVGVEHWYDDTPCSERDVRTLVHHLLSEQRWVSPLLNGLTIAQVGDRFEGDLMGDDPSQWAGLLALYIEEAHEAVAQPGALAQTVHLSYGDAPADEYVMQLTADLAIHSWDLARATGQDDTLDGDVVALLLPWTEASVDMWAGMGPFRPRIEVDAAASDDVRLLAPSWVAGPEAHPPNRRR
jgi:uncharacterized protein (TIGR03086 family)